MTRIFLASFILAMTLTAMAILAHAQTPQLQCMPRAALDKQIRTQYGESTIGAGLNPSGANYLTVNPQTGSWTFILLRPDGIACIIGGGKGWVSLPPVLPGTDI